MFGGEPLKYGVRKDYLQNIQLLNTTRLENPEVRSSETAEHYVSDMTFLALVNGIKYEELAKSLIRGLSYQLTCNKFQPHM